MTVFVVNSGSSSIKWELVEPASGQKLRGGLVERVTDHAEAMTGILDELGDEHPEVIGHRIVHGGDEFTGPTLIDDAVEAAIERLSVLAPLHNPGGLLGIRAARAAFPGVPQVAVFDTAFHQTLAPEAYTYAIPPELGIRRYGFHGTSYRYVSREAARQLGRDDARLIVFHLGNGASVCAIDSGRSVETSMGLTPLEGLVMGTRSGDIDAGVLLHLGRAGSTFDELDTLLNRRSGLIGLTGRGDMRDVQEAAAGGDGRAAAALGVYYHRLRHYLGAYIAHLGGVDAVVFTAGVGENSAPTRAAVLEGMEHFGIELDHTRNATRGERIISTDESRVAVLVIPTNEELEIARQAVATV